MTATYAGTREACQRAYREAQASGIVYDAIAKRGVHVKHMGEPRYERHEDHWHIQWDVVPR